MNGASPVPGLLTALEAAGVALEVNAAGDGLKVKAGTRPPADLLAAVRTLKPDLLAHLKGQAATLTSPAVAKPYHAATSSADVAMADPLPEHLAHMVEAAHAGSLPKGAQALRGGLVVDLTGYVLAWAECWPRDRGHVLRRLEEAYAVCRPRLPASVEGQAARVRGAA